MGVNLMGQARPQGNIRQIMQHNLVHVSDTALLGERILRSYIHH